MNSLDKDLYKQHAKRLQAILKSDSALAPYITRPVFAELLEKELNVLALLEKRFEKDILEDKCTVKLLVPAFNTLAKKEFKIDTNFKVEDDADLIDTINYLSTFCKNIFKVDLDDLVKGKKVQATAPNINFKSEQDVQVDPSQADFAGMAAMGGMAMAGNPYENPYFTGQAYAKLQQDAAKGTFYKYSTKPRIIPIVKKISLVLIAIAVLSLIVTSVFAFMTNGLAIRSVTDPTKTGTIGGVASGVLYILFAGVGVYAFYYNLRSLIKKNPNDVYYFSWPILIAFVLCSLIIVLPDMRLTWLLPSDVEITQTSGAHYIGYMAWKYGYIVCCVFCGLLIVPTIIGAVFNPKPDQNAIESKLREYVDHFTRMVPPSPSKPMDVQKPVDVKPTDKKKTDSKDKKDKLGSEELPA